jgi:ribonuclease J
MMTQKPKQPPRQAGAPKRDVAHAGQKSAPQHGRGPRRGPRRERGRHAPPESPRSFGQIRKTKHYRDLPADANGEQRPVGPRDESAVRFVPLGGLEEIGRNCSYFEYKNEIVVVDIGIQFPEEETPGIDYIIPNVSSLEGKKQNVKALLLTHGHYDHIAAIHYLIEKLGNPIIYTSKFTKAIVEKRHEEFQHAPKLKFVTVEEGSRVKLSEHFSAEFFEVEHTIPEAYGFLLETPVGNMVNFGDFRLDYDKNGEPRRLEIFERLGKRGVHSLFMDSTNADIVGRGASEETVKENLEALIKAAPGRIIITCFASLVDRIIEMTDIAQRVGRKVAVIGRSMASNLEIARQLGYLKEKKDLFIPIEEAQKYKDDKLLILTTGSQGEPNAQFMRIVNGEHRIVRLKPSDTVVFSSSVIPGNERSIQALQDNISRQVDEIYNSKLLDIHASGHCHKEDLAIVLSRVKPKYVVPIHGYYFKRKSVIKTAGSVGIDRDRVILMDNGQVAELTPEKFVVTAENVPAFYVMVDGLGVGDVEEVVLRDRRSLAQEGMIVAIITVDRHNGRLLKNPDIISRGFILMKDNQEILDEIRKRIRNIIAGLPAYREVEPDYLKTLIRDQLGTFLYNKTRRRPMLLPVIIEI